MENYEVTSLNGSSKWMDAFCSGEEWVFSKIYGRFQKPILKYVSQKIGDREIALDLVQDVFVKAFRFRASYQPGYAFSTWLWTIAKNSVSDWHRKSTREGQHDSLTGSPMNSGLDAMEVELPCPKPNAEILLQQKENRKIMLGMLKKLTGPQRKVIWLRVIHQISYEEISRRLGLSVSAVKCLAYRSRQALEKWALQNPPHLAEISMASLISL